MHVACSGPPNPTSRRRCPADSRPPTPSTRRGVACREPTLRTRDGRPGVATPRRAGGRPLRRQRAHRPPGSRPHRRAGRALNRAGRDARSTIEAERTRGPVTVPGRDILDRGDRRLDREEQLAGSTSRLEARPGGGVILRGSLPTAPPGRTRSPSNRSTRAGGDPIPDIRPDGHNDGPVNGQDVTAAMVPRKRHLGDGQAKARGRPAGEGEGHSPRTGSRGKIATLRKYYDLGPARSLPRRTTAPTGRPNRSPTWPGRPSVHDGHDPSGRHKFASDLQPGRAGRTPGAAQTPDGEPLGLVPGPGPAPGRGQGGAGQPPGGGRRRGVVAAGHVGRDRRPGGA